MFVFECVGVKERVGDEAVSHGGVLPSSEPIAWALKGLKVSGAPSPPRTDRQGPPARRTGGG